MEISTAGGFPLQNFKYMKNRLFLTGALLVWLAGCEQRELTEVPEATQATFDLEMTPVEIPGIKSLRGMPVDLKGRMQSGKSSSGLQQDVALINEQLIPYGIQLEKMEYFTAQGAGQTVFFKDTGNKRLASDFVPNDPRNALPGTDIPYIVDGTQASTASGLNVLAPIDAVMATWDNVSCAGGFSIYNAGVFPSDIGFVSNFFFGFGGSSGFFPGVIVHAGVLPKAFFDLVDVNGGNFILGVTFTLTYIEDINQDGKGDVAIKEVYYNDAFNWQDVVATGSGVDFQTVALHEVGHALSQAHFGKVTRTEANGKVHFSPRALMNAGYSGVNRVVEKTDKAGFCSNWSNWPNN